MVPSMSRLASRSSTSPGWSMFRVSLISCVTLDDLRRLPQDYAIIMGPLPTPEETKQRYKVDEVHYVDDLPSSLKGLSPNPTLMLLKGMNTDSGKMARTAAFDGN